MHKFIISTLILFVYTNLQAQEEINEEVLWNTPEWVSEVFESRGLSQKYNISSAINPFYLRGDFNGDGLPDISIFIEEKNTKKKGIAVLHSNTNSFNILGAGTKFGNGGDNFKWMDMWSVYKKQPVGQGVGEGEPPTLKSEALYVGKSEAASALIYWNGNDYTWYQQGD